MVPLKVLGNRVLIKPDVDTNAPEQLESGIYIAKTLSAAVTGEDATKSWCRGTVVAVGNPRHPLWHEAETLARTLEHYEDFHDGHPCIDAAAMLRDLVRRQPCVSVGDDVLVAYDAGQDIHLDGDTYILVTEDELQAVVLPEQEVAA